MAAKEQDAVAAAEAWLAQHGVATSSDRSGQLRPATDAPGPRSSVTASGRGGDDHEGGADAATDSGSGADCDADPESVARSIVLRKLAARAHTRAELERVLKTKRVPEEAIDTVLDRMVEVGLVDDEVFARDWVESRQRRRFLSKSALRQELTRKGVEREEIESAVGAVGAEDELAAARALAEKKAPALAKLDPQVRYRRMAGLLGRRGFSSGVVGRVLSEKLGDRAEIT
jgi:regulatory protein